MNTTTTVVVLKLMEDHPDEQTPRRWWELLGMQHDPILQIGEAGLDGRADPQELVWAREVLVERHTNARREEA